MRRPLHNTLDMRTDPEWVARPERGATWAIRAMVWVALGLGRPTTRVLLYPISLYFLLFSAKARSASRKYLAKVLSRPPRGMDLYRHFHTFSSNILDRVFLFNDQYSSFEVRVHGQEMLNDVIAGGQGCFLLGAHMGSFEIVRSLGREAHGPRVALVMYEENAQKLNSVLNAINPKLLLQVIALGKVDSMLKVEEALDRGEFVGMLGDRTIAGEGTVPCDFLGEQAMWATGPFRIAMILKRPIVLMFGLYRGGNRYDIYFEKLTDIEQICRSQRDLVLEQSLTRYVQRLEYYCRLFPYNWFNFYDFWQ